jgi:hypothetical protein
MDYLTKFQLKEMLFNPDYHDPEGMLTLAELILSLEDEIPLKYIFERYYYIFTLGITAGLSPLDLLEENISIAEEHPKMPQELRSIMASVGWWGFQNEGGDIENMT